MPTIITEGRRLHFNHFGPPPCLPATSSTQAPTEFVKGPPQRHHPALSSLTSVRDGDLATHLHVFFAACARSAWERLSTLLHPSTIPSGNNLSNLHYNTCQSYTLEDGQPITLCWAGQLCQQVTTKRIKTGVRRHRSTKNLITSGRHAHTLCQPYSVPDFGRRPQRFVDSNGG